MGQEEYKEGDLKRLEHAQRAVDRAFATGKADRAEITRQAQQDATKAVELAGVAMESDEAADEAARLLVISQTMGDRSRVKAARDHERAARDKAKSDHKAATKAARRAYDAIRFSDPSKLGFLRVVQALFAVHIVNTIVVLVLTSRDTVVYDSVNVVAWIMVVLEGVALWCINNRYRVGRPFVMGMAVFGIAAELVSNLVQGTFSLFALLSANFFYVFLIAYFGMSARVRTVLVNDLSKDKGFYEKDEFVIDRHGWPFVRNLIIYFVVFSVLGHWLEAALCQLIRLGLVQGEYDPTNTMLWRDWLYPYPMHGTAVVLIAVVLYPLYINLKKRFTATWKAYLASFVLNALACAVIELVGGLLFNANYQHWDYRNDFMNFMGQIDLQNTLAFGVAASLITWVVYPMLERWIARVRPVVMNIACVVIVTVGAILFSLYLISPPEGIDLGEHKDVEQVSDAEAEQDALRMTESLVSNSVNALDTCVSGLKYEDEAERARLKGIVEEMRRLVLTLSSPEEGSELPVPDSTSSQAS